MNITIRNISSIREATIGIKPVTVICGQSCTGKSLILDSIEEAINSTRRSIHHRSIISPLYRDAYVRRSLGTILLREGAKGLSITVTDKTSEIHYSGFGSVDYYGTKIMCIHNTYDSMTDFHFMDEIPGWVSRQVLQTDKVSEEDDFLARNMGMSTSLAYLSDPNEPSRLLNQVSIKVNGVFPYPVSLEREAAPFQRSVLTILYITDSIRHLYSGIEKVIILIKNPEYELSPRYTRKYVNTILDMYKTYRGRGLDVNFVIETHAPCVLNQIISQIERCKYPSEDFVVYGMDRNDKGHSYPRLRGYYSSGVLLDWEKGFLSL